MTFTPSPYLRITSDLGDRTARLALDGDLDYETAPNLGAAVTELLASRPDLRVLYLDCAQLDFCDTIGLAALLEIRKTTGEAGMGLVLDNRTPFLERVLEITGLLHHLTAAANGRSQNGYGSPDTG
ncbi:MAG TPA: STAS domain-containing protein [Pseudonocardia sp.]|jgi:anti-anti-sigma factor